MVWSCQIVSFLHDRLQIHQNLRNIKKSYSFSQFARNIFVPAEIEHDSETQRNTGVNDIKSHLHSFVIVFFLHFVIACYKIKQSINNWGEDRSTSRSTNRAELAI